MRIVDAVWELNTLGCTSQEIVIEDSDDLESVKQGLSEATAAYQVLKLDVCQVRFAAIAEFTGFHFVEGLQKLEIAVPQDVEEDCNDYEIMSAEDRVALERQIQSGLFSTDRIALDPHFGPQKAAARYINWIHDEANRGAVLLALRHKGKTVGFALVRKVDDDTCHSFLVGIYPEYAGRGLARLIIKSGLHYAKSQGCKLLTTSVSTNNMGSLRAHAKAGYLPTAMQYVFVRHNFKEKF